MSEQKNNICGCGSCSVEYQHKSDCAVHNEPAMPNGECDCKPFRCEWCEEIKEDVVLNKDCNKYLYNDCVDIYNKGEDKTGYCSFDCIMSGRCDETC